MSWHPHIPPPNIPSFLDQTLPFSPPPPPFTSSWDPFFQYTFPLQAVGSNSYEWFTLKKHSFQCRFFLKLIHSSTTDTDRMLPQKKICIKTPASTPLSFYRQVLWQVYSNKRKRKRCSLLLAGYRWARYNQTKPLCYWWRHPNDVLHKIFRGNSVSFLYCQCWRWRNEQFEQRRR